MKIRKHGKKYTKEQIKTEAFECKNCDCEFTCKEDEYYVDIGGADSNYCGSSLTYTISTVIKDYLVCSCPECHKIVKKIRERKNVYYTSLTGTSTTANYSDMLTPTVDEAEINFNANGLKPHGNVKD